MMKQEAKNSSTTAQVKPRSGRSKDHPFGKYSSSSLAQSVAELKDSNPGSQKSKTIDFWALKAFLIAQMN